MRKVASLLIVFQLTLQQLIQAQNAPAQALTKESVTNTVTSLADSVFQIYVDEIKAIAMRNVLRENLKSGKYFALATPDQLAGELTQDLLKSSNDKHFRVVPPAAGGQSGPMRMVMPGGDYSQFSYDNFFFRKVEILPGNVAYLEIQQFVPAQHAAALITAAMTFIANADAVIIDLRKCVGGSPATVAQLAGYFFESPVLLNVTEIRQRNQRSEEWTSKTTFAGREIYRNEAGKTLEREVNANYSKLTKVPLYILTSNFTFSAAEMFAYSMQAQGRAKVTGETTGGGGHGIRPVSLSGGYRVMLPFVRPVNPITKTGWEAVGVKPDINSSASEALRVAHLNALDVLEKSTSNPMLTARYTWDRDRAVALYHGAWKPTDQELQEFAGTYGNRKIVFENGRLHFLRANGVKEQISPLAKDVFAFEYDQNTKAIFGRNTQGQIENLKEINVNGRTTSNDREKTK